MSLEKVVSYFKRQDLTGEEIQKLVGKQPVLYSDLKKYKTIEALLGKENCVVVMYQTSSKTSGHFVSISKSKAGKLRYVDSYGLYPESEIQLAQYDQPLPKYLTALLGRDFEWSRIDYQSKQPAISTCGRWSSIFCLLRDVSLLAIHEMMSMNQSAYLKDTDNIATLLTILALNNIPEYQQTLPRGGQETSGTGKVQGGYNPGGANMKLTGFS